MFKKALSQVEQKLANGLHLKCPRCGEPAETKAQSLGDVITCGDCGFFGSVAEWGAKTNGPARHGVKPLVSTKITKETQLGTQIWNIPPTGRAGGLLVFGWIWSIMVGAMTLGAFIMGATGNGTINDEPATLGRALGMLPFMLPFCAIGAAFLYFAYRSKNARYRIEIGSGQITLTRDWLGKKVKSFSLAELESIAQVVFYTQNYSPVYGIEVKARSGKFRFGSSLRDEEKAWLVADFKNTVWPEAVAEEEEMQALADAPLAHGDGRFSILLPKSAGLKTFGIIFTLIGVAFLGVGIFLLRDTSGQHVTQESGAARIFDFAFNLLSGGFQWIWCLMAVGVLTAGVICLVKAIRGGDVERHLEGTPDEIALRKTRRGVVIEEKKFPRASVLDVRASRSGEMNGQPMMRVELITNAKAVKLAGWIAMDRAEQLVGEIKRAMKG